MLLIALLYSLLAMRVTVLAGAGLSGVYLEARAMGLALRFDGVIERREDGVFLRVAPRYGRIRPAHAPVRMRLGQLRTLRPYILAGLRAGCFERVVLHMRLGLDEAWSTALAAGAARALASALLSRMQLGAPELRVEADFRAPCFLLTARCIFSATPGDIMFAVLKTALKKSRREGFGWRSIPLKA